MANIVDGIISQAIRQTTGLSIPVNITGAASAVKHEFDHLNGDKKLSDKEIAARKQALEALKQRDADHDGKVSKNEKKAFEIADADKNGSLSKNELAARDKALKALDSGASLSVAATSAGAANQISSAKQSR